MKPKHKKDVEKEIRKIQKEEGCSYGEAKSLYECEYNYKTAEDYWEKLEERDWD